MKQWGHRSVAMVRRHIREGSLFVENMSAGWLQDFGGWRRYTHRPFE